jgi:hypothetical protein
MNAVSRTSSIDKIDTMDEFPDFKAWIRDGLINGYGVGQSEPWIPLRGGGL